MGFVVDQLVDGRRLRSLTVRYFSGKVSESSRAFNGKINKLTFNLGPRQLSEADKEKAAREIAIARD